MLDVRKDSLRSDVTKKGMT